MAAQPILVSELVLRTKQRADIEKSGSAGVVSDTEILRLLNLYGNQLKMEIDKTYEYYTATYFNIVTQAGVLRYSLPHDFYKLIGIGLVDVIGPSPNTWTPLQHWDFANQNIPGTGFITFTNGMYTRMTYRIAGVGPNGPNIEFRPVKSNQTLGIWYTPQFVPFKTVADPVPAWMMPGWEEYLIVGAAMMITAKEQLGVEMHGQIFKMIETQVRNFAPNRDEFQPETVKRVWTGINNGFGPFNNGYYGNNGF